MKNMSYDDFVHGVLNGSIHPVDGAEAHLFIPVKSEIGYGKLYHGTTSPTGFVCEEFSRDYSLGSLPMDKNGWLIDFVPC